MKCSAGHETVVATENGLVCTTCIPRPDEQGPELTTAAATRIWLETGKKP